MFLNLLQCHITLVVQLALQAPAKDWHPQGLCKALCTHVEKRNVFSLNNNLAYFFLNSFLFQCEVGNGNTSLSKYTLKIKKKNQQRTVFYELFYKQRKGIFVTWTENQFL